MSQQQHWLVVQTHRARELWAAENAERQGHDWYFPKLLKVCKRKNSPISALSEPLFPGFLFISDRFDGQWGHLLNTFGIRSILMWGGFPGRIKDCEIERFRKLEDENGFVILPKPDDGLKEEFTIGQQLRVVDGPYSGYHGIYQGQDSRQRIKILIDYFSRKTKVLIDPELVEKIIVV